MEAAKAILVVCTSETSRVRTAALLRQGGHAVHELAALGEVIAYVERECPPLLVIEFSPLDETARTICRQVRDTRCDTFILQLSPQLDGALDDDGVIDALLVDPVDQRELLTLVRSLLRLQKVEVDLRDKEDRLQLAQESAGLGILDWLIPTRQFVHSDNFLKLFDLPSRAAGETVTRDEIIGRIHPDDLPGLIQQAWGDSQHSALFDREYRIRLDDGSIRWIASRGRFFSDAGGAPERMLSLSFDVTQRKEAEHVNAVLASIVASSTDAIVSIDTEGTVTSWNTGAERLFNIAGPDIIGRPWLLALSDISEDDCDALNQHVAGGLSYEIEMRQTRGGGSPVDLWVSAAPIRASEGRVVGASLIMRDVSVQKQREDHIRFLMRELTHRSKNLLAVIQAMARQSLTKDVSPEEFIRRFTQRLAGLAGSHDLLSSVEWKGASLMELINSQLNHYEDLFGSRILLVGEDVLIRAEAAQNIGVALHELSTNAAKYGALSNSDGQVTITWTVHDDARPTLLLSWRESGGPPVVAPTRRGFGSIVMDRIAGRALDGRSAVRFEPDGVVWTLEVPVTSAIVTQ